MKSVIERAYVAKFETYFKEVADAKSDEIMNIFQKAKEIWEQSGSVANRNPAIVMPEFENVLLNVASETPHYMEVKSTIDTAVSLQIADNKTSFENFDKTGISGKTLSELIEESKSERIKVPEKINKPDKRKVDFDR